MRIEQWIRFLVENPLLLVVLLGWIAGGVGKIVQRRQKAQARTSRAPRAGGATPSSGPRARTAEEVAAEMRRILGMDGPRTEAPPKPLPPRPMVRSEASEGDREPAPLRPQRLGQVEIHVDPHVGEGVQRRAAPSSGQVTAHSLGTLGGRAPAVRAARGERRRLVALDDLTRAVVIREILDAPRALRGFDH